MSLEDEFKKYGAVYVVYDVRSVIQCVALVTEFLKRRNERLVIGLAVAGLLVRMHSAVANTTIDNSIELMRLFMQDLESKQKSVKA